MIELSIYTVSLSKTSYECLYILKNGALFVSIEFGKKVRDLREAKRKKDPKFSLRQFAQEIGVSAAFLSKVEIGEAPPPKAEKVMKMAKLLDANPDELLSLAGKIDPILPEYIRGQPKMADFLRTAREVKITDEQIENLTKQLKGKKA
jgi:HTH-type transcriptional regulator, competence development regulator